MATTTSELSDLARRIARQEAELAALRHQLEALLADLNRRRENLHAELRTVEAEIAVASQEGSPTAKVASGETTAPKSAALPAQETTGLTLTLAEFLMQLVGEAKGQPVSLAQLKKETVRRRYPSKSSNLPEMVGTRVGELLKRGQLHRDPDTGGLLLAASQNGQKAAPQPTPRPKGPAGRKPRPGAANTLTPANAGVVVQVSQPPLRAVLLAALKKAGRTMSAAELVERAQQVGYQSTSKRLKDVVWATMGKMPEVEHDPRGGYRLKKKRG